MSETISRVAVLGAGTMGHGIAHIAAVAGYSVTLYDIDAGAVERGMAAIRKNLDEGVTRGKVGADKRDMALANLTASTDLASAVGLADLVIEAAPERMDVKRQIFADVSRVAPPHAILATNTSSLSVTEIAAAAARPERVVGTHFFNPPHLVKLLEIVRAEQTAPDVVAAVRAAGERMEREIIVVGDTPGFATSRLGLVLGLEAIRMVEQGVATAAEIDKAMEAGYRHPMGPLRLTDLVGLDVRLAIAEYLYKELGGEQYRPPPLLRRMVRAGKLGKKSGEGFYTW